MDKILTLLFLLAVGICSGQESQKDKVELSEAELKLQSSQPAAGYPSLWSNEREYHFFVTYLDSLNQVISTEKLTIKPSGKIWEVDTKQTLLNFFLDSLNVVWSRIPDPPINGIRKLWSTNFQEGAIQNSTKIWMHPLRKNQYVLTELAPFPEIILPITPDTSWQSTLWVYKAFGSFEGTITCDYSILKQEIRSYNFGSINCWRIDAVGTHDKLGINKVIYYFNEEYGFTEMKYQFYNKQKIEINLIYAKL